MNATDPGPSLRLAPSLLLAGGVLVSTAVAVAADGSGILLFVSPGVMAAAMLAAGLLAVRRLAAPRAVLISASIHAAPILVAGTITGFSNPEALAGLMPVLGGATAGAFVAIHANAQKSRTACARLSGRSC
jgi:hypothetical protein